METRWLPVRLTTEEILHRSKDLTDKMAELDDLEAAKKLANDSFAEQIKAKEKEIQYEARIIRNRAEDREVGITHDKDWDKKEVSTRRTDTGEVIGVRPMTVQELNLELFPATTEKKRKKDTPASVGGVVEAAIFAGGGGGGAGGAVTQLHQVEPGSDNVEEKTG